jgi:3-methyladenine DNA glycosylase AlkC
MSRSDEERASFLAAPDREAYLRSNSRLPGPRANLELLAVAADEVDRQWAISWAAAPAGDDPTDVFVIAVALAAQSNSLAAGNDEALALLRHRAADGEWRIREAVAIGLQRLGDDDPGRLAEIATAWAHGSPLESRAAVAAVAEPRLLKSGELVGPALEVMDTATEAVAAAAAPVSQDIRVLRQALGYAWSVVVAANPDVAWPRFQRWARSDNADVRWIVAENMRKDRIKRLKLSSGAPQTKRRNRPKGRTAAESAADATGHLRRYL